MHSNTTDRPAWFADIAAVGGTIVGCTSLAVGAPQRGAWRYVVVVGEREPHADPDGHEYPPGNEWFDTHSWGEGPHIARGYVKPASECRGLPRLPY